MSDEGEPVIAREVRGAVQIDYSAAPNDQTSAALFEQLLKKTIEHQPYTAVLMAVAVGWLLGRTHRPF